MAELLGDSKRVAQEHYVYALTDYREVDRAPLLARAPGVLDHAREVRTPVRTPA